MKNIEEKILIYEKKSLELIELLEKENYIQIDDKLDDRKLLLDTIDETDKGEFIEIYYLKKINTLDDKIKELFNSKIDKLKQELIKYNYKKQGNIVYSKTFRNKIDIFDKKV
ncbi:hypothetical protein KQI18_08630 [Clostridioides mangenotii]|uniref:hypothetical protein n=1 Tax=Metaclostridioides mangenotii TaxID=1540 RepID=UPI001C0F45AB|nr:hypothetical protein [Clostridioides mangenotii]MBU5307850.1 hypothetical protein [Clostridioides mangenotii]